MRSRPERAQLAAVGRWGVPLYSPPSYWGAFASCAKPPTRRGSVERGGRLPRSSTTPPFVEEVVIRLPAGFTPRDKPTRRV